MNENKNRYAYRLPPCPSYDVEGMESWLGDMAQRGLLLTKDGFFGGFATFLRTRPRQVRYRLAAAEYPTGLLSPNDRPSDEEVELSAESGWEYVAGRGDFHIYRTDAPGARELNTDPEVQAIAMNMVRKRQRDQVIPLFFWVFVWPLLRLDSGPLLQVAHTGLLFFLLGLTVVLWFFGGSVAQLVHLSRLRRQLQAGIPLRHDKNWQRTARWHFIGRGLRLVLLMTWVVLLGVMLNRTALDEHRTPLEDWDQPLPFATMADFAGTEEGYDLTFGNDRRFNSVFRWHTAVSRDSYDWKEHVSVGDIDGGLYVDYHRMRWEWLAKWMLRELQFSDWISMMRYRDRGEPKTLQQFALPQLDADEAVAYRGHLHFPVLLLRRGDTVCRVMFYQTGETQIPLEEWTRMAAELLQ